MDMTDFKAKYPDLYNAILDDGKKEGLAAGKIEGEAAGLEKGKAEAQAEAKADGAKAETERIKNVEAQLIPGHETLIDQLKFDGKTTGEQAAVQILQAEKALRTNAQANLDDDAVAAVAHIAAQDDGSSAASQRKDRDFDQLVTDYQEKHDCSKGTAISAVAKAHPDAHESWLSKVNKGGK